ncbi:hypothetical protein [Massilia pseudoviolaceinigra]|uniref:hypothetical protein n=1 Tax=Massilia pseudoviolaceinigra TaxID=3057165 RepID=UPI0027968369|nr:hypothetical protein [Massilia sp. CCM 9206]MDQ1922032.1 hypothetical protein [Massilia sp. CCM 9206]
MERYRLYATGLMLALGLTAHASAQTHSETALTKERQAQIQAQDALSVQVAPIKSQADLIQYMKMVPPQSNALYLLSPTARERFVSSLTFNQHGLSGFSYADLQRELSPAKIARVLRLFGSESSVSTIQTQGGTTARPERWESANGECRGFLDPAWGTCDQPLPGGGGLPGNLPGGGGGGGGGRGGGAGPSDPVGQEPQPKPMPNGDYWNYRCTWGGGGCAHQTNSICKAKC